MVSECDGFRRYETARCLSSSLRKTLACWLWTVDGRRHPGTRKMAPRRLRGDVSARDQRRERNGEAVRAGRRGRGVRRKGKTAGRGTTLPALARSGASEKRAGRHGRANAAAIDDSDLEVKFHCNGVNFSQRSGANIIANVASTFRTCCASLRAAPAGTPHTVALRR